MEVRKNIMSEKVDILDRQPFVDRLIEIVHMIADGKKGCMFTIDGQWGCGKSFILDMFEKQLSLIQDPTDLDDRYIIFHYNCWQYDFYDEPAIAIISAIKDEIEKYNKVFATLPEEIQAGFEVAKDLGKKLLNSYLKTKFGINFMEWFEKVKEKKEEIIEEKILESEYDVYYHFKEALDSTKDQLKEISKDKTVILVVDELDRCLPQYAIKVLERLHHFFDEDSNIIVILATDRKQLERTVEKIFCGNPKNDNSFIVQEYLKKFISFSISLDKGILNEDFWNRFDYILSAFEHDKSGMISDLPQKLFKGIDIRTQERIMERLWTLHRLSFDAKVDPAVLFWEMLHQVLSYKGVSDAADVLLRLNIGRYPSLEEILGKELTKYLKDLEHTVGRGIHRIIGSNNYIEISDFIIDHVFWLASSSCQKNEKALCNHFYFEQYESYEKMVAGVRKFNQLSKLIK